MNLDDLLGIDSNDPLDRHADYLVTADEDLIEDLVRFRHQRRLSQADIAELMGIDKSGVSKIESGGRDLLLSTLRRYAMAVGAVIDHRVHSFADVDGARRAREYFSAGASFSSPPGKRRPNVTPVAAEYSVRSIASESMPPR